MMKVLETAIVCWMHRPRTWSWRNKNVDRISLERVSQKIVSASLYLVKPPKYAPTWWVQWLSGAFVSTNHKLWIDNDLEVFRMVSLGLWCVCVCEWVAADILKEHSASSSDTTASFFESFDVFNHFLPFKLILDAFCPITYSHNSEIFLYIIFPSNFWSSCQSCRYQFPLIIFWPSYHLSFGLQGQTSSIFVS